MMIAEALSNGFSEKFTMQTIAAFGLVIAIAWDIASLVLGR